MIRPRHWQGFPANARAIIRGPHESVGRSRFERALIRSLCGLLFLQSLAFALVLAPAVAVSPRVADWTLSQLRTRQEIFDLALLPLTPEELSE